MARFLFFLMLVLALSLAQGLPVQAMGVSDFVAVADGPNNAVYNPAGLATQTNSFCNFEYRFVGYDQIAFGWDDLFVYAAPGNFGNGALFLAYRQDWLEGTEYNRDYSLGYSFGWQPSDNLLMGLSAKFNTYGMYNDLNGSMVNLSSQANFLLDFGTIVKATPELNLGLAIHNIGKSDQSDALTYDSTIGLAYHTPSVVIATEIYNFLRETNPILQGPILRVGARFEIFKGLRLHLITEGSDWSYQGQTACLEYVASNHLGFAISWQRVQSNFLKDFSIQASAGYHF
jgi:hypothetical protein